MEHLARLRARYLKKSTFSTSAAEEIHNAIEQLNAFPRYSLHPLHLEQRVDELAIF